MECNFIIWLSKTLKEYWVSHFWFAQKEENFDIKDRDCDRDCSMF